MKFSTREDIDAPIEQVFRELCDFDLFERQAIRRGADVERTDTLKTPGFGMTWKASFPLRGKRRDLELRMVRFDAPNEIGVDASSTGIDAQFAIELIALSRTRTRVTFGLELRPKNLSARLLIQSLKLAKGTLSKKFKLRVAEYARTLEDRLRKSA